MAGPESIPELTYQKPDGSLFNRLEMEEQMRKVWPKIHWVRLKANKIYGLSRQAAFDMREAVIRHWTLDEMIRRGQISGDMSGVDAITYNDEAVTRQFIQSLQYLIQSGQAITPSEGEGIDMNNFVPPPPPMGAVPPPNGAPQQQPMQFQQPAPQGFPPPGMPAGMPATPPGPPMAPQQMQPPPMQQPPQMMMPPGGPQYAPPMPGTGMPQMPSTPVPPMPGSPPPQMPAPQQATPQGGGRRKRGGGGDQPPPQAAPVPPMPGAGGPQGYPPPAQFGPPGAPQPMGPPGVPQGGYAPPPAGPPQQQFSAPPMQQAPAPVAAAPDPRLDQVLANQQQIIAGQAKLLQEWTVLQAGLATWLRATYQRPGAPDLKTTLTELGIQFPQ
jgi:hypothetical protein